MNRNCNSSIYTVAETYNGLGDYQAIDGREREAFESKNLARCKKIGQRIAQGVPVLIIGYYVTSSLLHMRSMEYEVIICTEETSDKWLNGEISYRALTWCRQRFITEEPRITRNQYGVVYDYNFTKEYLRGLPSNRRREIEPEVTSCYDIPERQRAGGYSGAWRKKNGELCNTVKHYWEKYGKTLIELRRKNLTWKEISEQIKELSYSSLAQIYRIFCPKEKKSVRSAHESERGRCERDRDNRHIRARNKPQNPV